MMEEFTIERGKYRYYTPEFFDYIFFPKDTLEVSKYSSKEESNDGDSQNERNEEMLKSSFLIQVL